MKTSTIIAITGGFVAITAIICINSVKMAELKAKKEAEENKGISLSLGIGGKTLGDFFHSGFGKAVAALIGRIV